MIKWKYDVEVKNFNEVPGDFANTERVPNPPKVFKKGDTIETKYIFKQGDFDKYIVFVDDSIAIVPADWFCSC